VVLRQRRGLCGSIRRSGFVGSRRLVTDILCDIISLAG
jgi:hypothetical protein